MNCLKVRRVLLCCAFLFLSALALRAQTVRYIYDELGRLVAVIDQNGDAAIYNYDAVGNLLSIARQSAGSVSILEFTPNGAASVRRSSSTGPGSVPLPVRTRSPSMARPPP